MSSALLAAVLAACAVVLAVPGTGRARATSTRRPGWLFIRRRSEPGGERSVVDAGTLLDLTAALLTAGSGIEASLDRLARTVPGAEPLSGMHRGLAAGADWEQAAAMVSAHPELAVFCEHLSFAHVTGAPSASMLQAAAAQARAERRHEAERKASELGVKMMLPLGACFLPAFILLGVVPVILSMLPGALGLR